MSFARLVVTAAFLTAQGFAGTLDGSAWLLAAQAPSAGSVPGVPAAQQPRDTRPQTGTARIRGRVTNDAGQPVRRVPVRLNGAVARATNTDTTGRFEFTSLPAGRYSLFTMRQGYIASNGETFDVAEGEQHDGVNLQLARGGVITGQVIDEFGDPVIGAPVTPMRMQFQQGQRRLVGAAGSGVTNDLGEYRLFGLAPADYYVSVAPRNETATIVVATAPGVPGVPTVSGSSDGYAPTYYPGTPDVAGAQRLSVAAGQTLANVNITLSPARLARVKGTALDAQGRPLTRGVVNIAVKTAGASNTISNAGQIQTDGSFLLVNVPPGSYSLRATIPPATPPTPGQGTPPAPPQFAIGEVIVNGDDVDGVVLSPPIPIPLHGRIVFDDAAAQQSVRPSTARVMAQVSSQDLPLGLPAAPAPVNEDFTFQTTAQAGLVFLRVSIPTANGVTWRVKSIHVHGLEVVDTGVELKAGESVDDVDIEMTRREQVVSGQVLDARGQPAKQFSVVLFSQDRSRWTNPTNRYWAVAAPQPQGGYKMSNLPPGDYYAIAIAGQSNIMEWSDPDFLEKATRDAVRFSLHEGEPTTLDVRLRTP